MGNRLILFTLLFVFQNIISQDLSVMTYNIKFDEPRDTLHSWQNRKDFLISQLRFYAPYILGIQEGLYHQLLDIEKMLDVYQFFGVGRESGDTRGEHCAVFYNTNHVKLISHNTFWLSETPEKPTVGWDAALKRICTYGVFERKENNKRFLVLNTHFDHIGEQARIKSSILILKKINEINTKNLPVLLMGDFNLEINTRGIEMILKELEDTHVVARDNAFGPKGTFNDFRFDKPVTRKIDYIFSSKDDFIIIKSGILSDSQELRYPSDHFPIYTELNFKE